MSSEQVVHIVDDDAAMRDAMRTLFNSVSIATRCYGDAEEFLNAVNNPEDEGELAGCVVLDLRMPGMSGLEVQNALTRQGCELPVIFITGHGKISTAVRAMHGGAVDFLTKPVDDELLLETVQEALRRDQDQRHVRAETDKIAERVSALTPREKEVLQAVTRGLSNKEIARELHISHKTVELYRAHMMEKMQANSIAEVVQMYLVGAAVEPHFMHDDDAQEAS